MKTIKFSHIYEKMPKDLTIPTTLMHVFVDDVKNFGQLFVNYDTIFITDMGVSMYELPKGKVLVLLLITHNHVWTTIRRWTPEKEKYYRGLIGQDVKIDVGE